MILQVHLVHPGDAWVFSTRTSPSIWWPTSFQPKELIGSDLKAFRSFPSRIPWADEGLVNLCRRNPPPEIAGLMIRVYENPLVSRFPLWGVRWLTSWPVMIWWLGWFFGAPGCPGQEVLGKGEDQWVISQIYPTYKYCKWKNPSIPSPLILTNTSRDIQVYHQTVKRPSSSAGRWYVIVQVLKFRGVQPNTAMENPPWMSRCISCWQKWWCSSEAIVRHVSFFGEGGGGVSQWNPPGVFSPIH